MRQGSTAYRMFSGISGGRRVRNVKVDGKAIDPYGQGRITIIQ